MNISCFFDKKIYVENNIVICSYVSNGNQLTELRMLFFLEEFKKIIKSLYDKKIKRFIFIYDIDKLTIPINFELFTKYFTKDFVQIFKDNIILLKEKLLFTIIKSESTLFHSFFKIFKKFYIPIKPLYICKSMEEGLKSIHCEKTRNKLLLIDIEK
tara:strand:- start:55 stop:522 length:468 start_codon:yes stop_codon:yes gene_type:complete